ncbi:helix-turn-helix transcriptional regulator [Thiocapsa sp.]|uniref:helix-turn-helix domain-containing protein n=1 Tax=Thiocapsa sp. TaxID=2024551 RepID=UPI002B5DA200|nr:helix-turn-helix transcriptional regulator [Thiocapsa sp.]HSO81362.1 helix-turn-helix transcriptional regulator [Thiocapsa sp.]
MDTSRNHLIGERIRSAREHHHLSHEDLAGRTTGQITPSRLRNDEEGIRRTGIEDTEAMAAVFGDVSAAWLLTLDSASESSQGQLQVG